MLTQQEQEDLLARTLRLVAKSKELDSKRRAGIMSPQSARQSWAKMVEDFKDHLKEIG